MSAWASWVVSLGRGGERREGHDHRADPRDGQHRDDQLRPVRVEQADVTALACAEGEQTAGELGRASVGIGVAEAVGVADQQRMRAPRCCLPSQYRPDGRRLHPPRMALRSGLPTACGGSRRRSRSRSGSRSVPTGFAGSPVSSSASADAPSRSSTTATGVSPRRSSGRPTTAAPARRDGSPVRRARRRASP